MVQRSMSAYNFNFKHSYKELDEILYSCVDPIPVADPKLVIINEALADSLNLDFSNLSDQQQANLFSGNILSEGSAPLAQAYAGHQFGHFAILGDGRAHLLGEHVTPSGNTFDIQLKGSGPTPYSRNGDGRAALGPMLREYIISESMHALGIPTTRSLAVVSTGEQVRRETPLPGAILTRVASSHIRIGTFQFAAAQKDKNLLKALLDYTIDRHEPLLKQADNPALALLESVIQSQSDLIVNWLRVGFIHGVMNTDNITLSGETIDYGPCAFIDHFDPNKVFSSIDRMGRYSYENQPKIIHWNMARLAETLLPLINENIDKSIEVAKEKINEFETIFEGKYLSMMRAKLGLFGEQKGDKELYTDLTSWMHRFNKDFTNTFRDLSKERLLDEKSYQNDDFRSWHKRWKKRQEQNDMPRSSSIKLMEDRNPTIIPRNHNVEKALQAAQEQNFAPFSQLLESIKNPYQENPKLDHYKAPPKAHERVLQTFCGT
ncbi:MAG: YdiU family protein [Pseudomonadota bacterium]|nr:YdiU family protein [Pseudomonadota bacterium]